MNDDARSPQPRGPPATGCTASLQREADQASRGLRNHFGGGRQGLGNESQGGFLY